MVLKTTQIHTCWIRLLVDTRNIYWAFTLTMPPPPPRDFIHHFMIKERVKCKSNCPGGDFGCVHISFSQKLQGLGWYSILIASPVVTWLEYCSYGVKHKTFDQPVQPLPPCLLEGTHLRYLTYPSVPKVNVPHPEAYHNVSECTRLRSSIPRYNPWLNVAEIILQDKLSKLDWLLTQ